MTLRTQPLSFLIAAAIFLAPLNLFFKWHETNAYVSGIFTDYLLPKIWIAEIPVLLAIIVWAWKKIRDKKKKNTAFLKKNAWIVLGVLALLLRQFFSPLPEVSLLYFWRMVELSLFAWCLKELWPTLHHKLIQVTLALTVLFQAGVLTLQFFRQKPLFEYMVLGETQFSGPINITRVLFKTGQVIVPYGTTAHPNIAAGVIAIFGALWLSLRTKTKRAFGWKELAFVGVISWALFLTQSWSATVAFVLFLCWQMFPIIQKHARTLALSFLLLIPALLVFASDRWLNEMIYRRTFLNAHAVATFQQQPFLGTGLGMFTTTLKNAPSTHELVRFVQPTHNLPLLWLAETGVLGILLLFLAVRAGIFSQQKNGWLLMIVPILSLDHYLLTQWVGAFSLIAILAIAQEKRKA